MLTTIKNFYKLVKFLSSLEIKQDDRTIYVKSSKNLIIESEKGSILLSSPLGYSIISSKELHLNPDINFTKVNKMDEIEMNRELVDAKLRAIEQQKVSITTHNKVKHVCHH